MARPLKPRRVLFDPDVVYFKPRAVPLSLLEEVDLSMDDGGAAALRSEKSGTKGSRKENESFPEHSPENFDFGQEKSYLSLDRGKSHKNQKDIKRSNYFHLKI